MIVLGLALAIIGGFIATQNTHSKVAIPMMFSGLVLAMVGAMV